MKKTEKMTKAAKKAAKKAAAKKDYVYRVLSVAIAVSEERRRFRQAYKLESAVRALQAGALEALYEDDPETNLEGMSVTELAYTLRKYGPEENWDDDEEEQNPNVYW